MPWKLLKLKLNKCQSTKVGLKKYFCYQRKNSYIIFIPVFNTGFQLFLKMYFKIKKNSKNLSYRRLFSIN